MMREILNKCKEYIGKFSVHMRETPKFWQKLVSKSGSLPPDEGGITCMHLWSFFYNLNIFFFFFA